MNKFWFFFAYLSGIISVFIFQEVTLKDVESPDVVVEVLKPLEKYSTENLSQNEIHTGKINVKEKISENEKYTSYLFEFFFNPNLDGKTIKKTTGMINIPIKPADVSPIPSSMPLVLMLRGYVDPEYYQTGMGTKNVANHFAENGYITIAPDFLGYAGSDKESSDIFETRFQTYITVLSLLQLLDTLKDDVNNVEGTAEAVNLLNSYSELFLWAHSNGGQIGLTVLEITGRDIPTMLWAPVSKSFPYSILVYSDEPEDNGKILRNKLAEFEKLYDTEKYSLTNYLERINAPIQLIQGTLDTEIPVEWTYELSESLKDLDMDIEYIVYNGADHNMRPHWESAVQDNLSFMAKHSKNTPSSE